MKTTLFMKFKQENPREGLAVELFYEGYAPSQIGMILRVDEGFARRAVVHWWATDKAGAQRGKMR